jgi:hypothetical protein
MTDELSGQNHHLLNPQQLKLFKLLKILKRASKRQMRGLPRRAGESSKGVDG